MVGSGLFPLFPDFLYNLIYGIYVQISIVGEHGEDEEAGQPCDRDDAVQQEDVQQGVIPVDEVSKFIYFFFFAPLCVISIYEYFFRIW